MIRFSKGLLDAIMGNAGFRGAMQGGVVRVFSGTRPATANDAIPVGCVELARITTDGKTFYPGSDTNAAGLQFSLQSGGTLNSIGAWVLVGRASGVPLWFRWNWGGVDNNVYSGALPRIDGDVGPDEMSDLVIPLYSIFPSTRYRLEMFEATISG